MNLDNVIAVRADKTIYRDGDRTIKVFSENYEKSAVLNEALNLARAEEAGAPAPRLHEVTKVDGKWAIIYDYIPGKNMSQLLKEEPEREDELLEDFIDLQIAIHKLKSPLLTKLKDKMQRKISLTGFNATVRYELHMRLGSKPGLDKIIHGDFCPSNVIVSDDGEGGTRLSVIDWSHATQGDDCADAARTYLLFWLQGEICRAQKYLDLYARRSDTAKQRIQQWLPILAASQTLKKKPEELEFLKSWVNVSDYE